MTPCGRPARRWLLPLMVVSVLLPGTLTRPVTAANGSVLIFAAASLQTVLDELSPDVERALGVDVRTSYGATSALARQIENGAPADVFISADRDWMDYLERRHRIQRDSRIDLVGNRLVLVAPAGRSSALRIGPDFHLSEALGRDRLAIADPDSVPAGRYARAALMTLGVWTSVAAKVAPAENVRAALMLVARGEAPLGIVYRTDAVAEPKVQVVDVFPAATHPAIVYPAALTMAASPGAGRVLAYLQSPRGLSVFIRHGFLSPR